MHDLIYQIYKINKSSKTRRPVNNLHIIKNKTEPHVNLSYNLNKLMSESIKKYIRKLDDTYNNYNKNNNIYQIGYNNQDIKRGIFNSKYKCNEANSSGYIFLLGLGASIFLFIRRN